MAQEQTNGLCDYISNRVQRYGILIDRKGNSFCFNAHGHKITLTPQIEFNDNNLLIYLKVDIVPPEYDEWRRFLDELKDNAIFRESGELYLKERFENLRKWEEVLERKEGAESNDGKLVCMVKKDDGLRKEKPIDRLFKQRGLCEAVFELMVRPALYFAYSRLKEEN